MTVASDAIVVSSARGVSRVRRTVVASELQHGRLRGPADPQRLRAWDRSSGSHRLHDAGPAYPFTVSFADELECNASDTLGLFAYQNLSGAAATAAGSWLAVSLASQF